MTSPYASRQERLLAVAEKEGLQALVLYANELHSSVEMDPVWYATGFTSLGRCIALLISGRDPILLFQPAWDAERANKSSTADVRYASDLFGEIRREFATCGLSPEEVGICGAGRFNRQDLASFNDVIGSGWHDFDRAALRMAAIKDEYEQELVRRAIWIAEEGYRHALEEAHPGMPEFEFTAHLDVYMRELGADDNYLMFSASQHNYAVKVTGDRIFAKGDILLAEISPSYMGAFAQICRTSVIGEPPSPTLSENYEILRSAFAAGLKACIPGRAIGEMVAALDDTIVAAGFGEYCRAPYFRQRGHGMGSGSTWPRLEADSSTIIEEGMTFILHPNQYLPATGYLMCGDHLLVGPQGVEVLAGRRATLDCAGA